MRIISIPLVALTLFLSNRAMSETAEYNLGLLGFYQSGQYKEQPDEYIPYPWLGLRMGDLVFDRNRASYSLLTLGKFEMGLYATYEFDGYEENESPILRGMKSRASGLQFGAEIEYEVGPLDFGLDFTRDVTGVHSGHMAVIEVGIDKRMGDNLQAGVSVGVEVYDSTYSDFYFGVRPNEATPTRKAYRIGATINPVIEADIQYRLNDDYSLAMQIEHVINDNAIRNSPIVEKSSRSQIFLGFSYSGFFHY